MKSKKQASNLEKQLKASNNVAKEKDEELESLQITFEEELGQLKFGMSEKIQTINSLRKQIVENGSAIKDLEG